MRFNLVDRIVNVEVGQQICMVKNLTLGEEYLADHFPTFPVMPGVLMLQALVEASSWLIRLTEDFRHSVIVAREAKNVKYGNFMEPGRTLTITSEWAKSPEGAPEDQAVFKAKGEVDGTATVSAKLVLARYNLQDRNPALKATDEKIINHLKSQLLILNGELSGNPVGSS